MALRRSQLHQIGFMWHPKLSNFLHIVVERWTSFDHNHQTPVLSVDLQDEDEIDQAIEELKTELDAAGRRAKAAIKRRRMKQQNY